MKETTMDEQMREEVRQLIAEAIAAALAPPPPSPPPATGDQRPLSFFLSMCMSALLEDFEADLGGELRSLEEAWQHYVQMYRAYRGEEPTAGENARAFTLAWVNGRVEEKLPNSDSGAALRNLLNETFAEGIAAPRVWLDRPDWLGRRDRPMQAADQYWKHPVTGGDGQLPPTPVLP